MIDAHVIVDPDGQIRGPVYVDSRMAIRVCNECNELFRRDVSDVKNIYYRLQPCKVDEGL